MAEKIATINLKNDDNNCYQYTFSAALNYQNIKCHPERVSNIQLFIGQYNWKEIDFPSEGRHWTKFELNNKSIALNILFVPYKIEKIRLAYKSKHNFKHDNKVI